MDSPITPGAVVAARLVALRGSLLWSQEELARRMTAYGLPWSRTTVAKIENMSRQVSVDELVAVAFVLGVSPAALLTPTSWSATVQVTPNTQTHAVAAWRWITGSQQAGGALPDDVLSPAEHEVLLQRYDEACPDFIRTAERRLPGLRRLVRTASNATSAAAMPEPFVDSAYENAAASLELLAEDAAALAKRARSEAALAAKAKPAPTTKRKAAK